MTDSVGLKNMVTVAAACLRSGLPIRIGESRESDVLGGKTGERKGPVGDKGEKKGNIGVKGLVKGKGAKKGFAAPNQNGICANPTSLIHIKRVMIKKMRIYLFMGVSPLKKISNH